MDWLGQLLRFTVFPKDAWEPLSTDVWGRLGLGELETEETKARERSRRQQGGFHDNIILDVQLSSPRVDFLFAPKAIEPRADDNFGKASSVIPDAVATVNRWLPHAPFEVSRVAIATVLTFPVESRRSGYEAILSATRSLKFDPSEEMSDLLFQINRPCNSNTVNGLKINRLMKLATVQITLLSLSGAVGQTLSQAIEQPTFACRLETDVNTVPQPNGLEKVQLNTIFAELAEITITLAANGEPA